MKTAVEILSDFSISYGTCENNPRAVVMALEAMSAMREYAKEAIKTDRKNLLDYIKVNCDSSETFQSVDENSIINAPQINLP